MFITNRNCKVNIKEKGVLVYTLSMNDYRMNITINKSVYTSLNGKAEITIENLDHQIVEFLSKIYSDDTDFKIDIVYDDELVLSSSLVNIDEYYDVKSSTKISTLYLYLGWVSYKTKVNKDYEKDTPVTEVIEDLVKEVGLQSEVVNSVKGCLSKDRSLLKSITVSDSPINEIKKLLKSCLGDNSVNMFVDEDTVKVVPREHVINSFTITKDNCLEPAPQINDYGVKLILPFVQFKSLNCIDQLDIQITKEYVNYAFDAIATARLDSNRIDYIGKYKVTDLAVTIDNNSANIAKCEVKAIRL